MERPVFTPPFTALDAGARSTADYRRAPRRSVRLRAHLRDEAQSRFDLEMTDLSGLGFRAATAFPLQAGATVWLTLPGLAPVEAAVTWQQPGQYGCAFIRPLHPAVLEHLLDMSA